MPWKNLYDNDHSQIAATPDLCQCLNAHQHLSICRLGYEGKVPPEAIKLALKELRTIQQSNLFCDGERHQIECNRFVGLASYKLATAPLSFLSSYPQVWATSGALAGAYINHHYLDQKHYTTNRLLEPYCDQFYMQKSQDPWQERAAMLKGIRNIAAASTLTFRQNTKFWDLLRTIDVYFTAILSLGPNVVPLGLCTAIECYLDIYWTLSKNHSQDRDVILSICTRALQLLNLIALLRGAESGASGRLKKLLHHWEEMLLQLKLSPDSPYWNEVKGTLDQCRQKTYRIIGQLFPGEPWLQLSEFFYHLSPYLRGESPCGDRRKLCPIEIQTGNDQWRLEYGGKLFIAKIVNICGRTASGFLLELDQYDIMSHYVSEHASLENTGSYEQKICIENLLGQLVTVEPNFPLSEDSLVFQCKIQRAWPRPLASGGEGIGLVAVIVEYPPKHNDPNTWSEWVNYVSKLPYFRKQY